MEDTLPKLLRRNYQKYGDKKVAMREKDFGIWQEYTWKDYYEKVKYFSLGLISLGLERGDKVSIIGENKPEWYWAELAVHAAGGAILGIFSDCIPSEVKYYVEHSDSKFVVAHDQEQVDKLLQIKDELPLLKKIIYWDPKGLGNYDDPLLMSFNEVIELGKEYEKFHPNAFEENIDKGRGEDIAVLLYTSGTTGLPKGAMVNHKSLISILESWMSVDKWTDKDRYVSFIPPGWVGEQWFGVTGSLVSGMEVNFPEEPETVQENLREIGPTVLLYGVRLWESVVRTIQAKIIDTSPLRRFLYHLFLPVGYKRAELRLTERRVSWFWRILFLLADLIVFRALRDKVGLSHLRRTYTGGAPISPSILQYFQAIGVDIKLSYGLSETGMLTVAPDDYLKWETCGPTLPGVEIKLSEEGEILVRNPNLLVGYYKDPETTAKKLKGGWFHTGDFGHFDEDGQLIVIDRMEDLKELSGGRRFSPQYCETRLRFSPYIKDVLVVGGEDKPYATAIVNIDLDNVGRWAEARRIPYTTFVDLSQKPEVIELIRKDIQRVNKALPEWARIKRFANLHKEFDPDEAELTRTRKIRRTFIEDRYRYLIDALYSDKTELMVEAPITYRDGRKGVIQTAIKLTTLD